MTTVKSWFTGRSVAEVLIVMVGATVCSYVIISTFVVIVLAFATDKDVSDLGRNIADIINTLIGLLAGFLAGRTDLGKKVTEEENTPNSDSPSSDENG